MNPTLTVSRRQDGVVELRISGAGPPIQVVLDRSSWDFIRELPIEATVTIGVVPVY